MAGGVATLFGGLAAGGMLDGERFVGAEALGEDATMQWHGTEDLLGHTRRMSLGFTLGLPGHIGMGPNL